MSALDSSRGGSPLGRSGRGGPGRVDVIGKGPIATSHLLWRDGQGALFCTVIAKTTFELRPGDSPVVSPLPIQEVDAHWDDNPDRSVHVPSDVAPFKPCAEVVLVGSAFAAEGQPRAFVDTRLVVGSIDKSVTVFGPRRFAIDGALSEPKRLVRFSLGYEHAAGGVGTDNPTGIDTSRIDALGARSVPSILPRGLEVSRPEDFVPMTGFGPIAPGWPSRALHLRDRDRSWAQRPADGPMPATFPVRFFQVAPLDQWLDRSLAASERIVLEGLHVDAPRLVTTLAGLDVRAIVRGSSEALRLEGDLLVIDTDRALATLTSRVAFRLDERGGVVRVLVVAMRTGESLDVEGTLELQDIGALLAEEARLEHEDDSESDEETTDADPFEFTSAIESRPQVRASLPFTDAADAPKPSRPSMRDGALPFRESDFGFEAAHPAGPTPPPSMTEAASLPRPMLDAAFAVSSAPSSLASSTTPSAWARADRQPSAAVAETVLSEGNREPVPFRDPSSARAASDAAIRRETSARDSSKGASRSPAPAPLERRAMVDLLAVSRGVADRVRTMKAFAGAFARPVRSRPLASPDVPAPLEGDRDRADVLRVLSYATPFEPRRIRRAWEESFADSGDLEPPLVLVAGDLRPTYDEFELLRATLAAALPVAGGDKRLVALCATAEEMLAKGASVGPDAAVGLARQIEQASASMPIPPRYVAREAERALLEGRRYKRRTLLGSPRIRCDFGAPGEADTFLFYAPDIADSLPLLPSFPVIALCEVRPREDLAEPAADALFAVALGRVLRLRGDG